MSSCGLIPYKLSGSAPVVGTVTTPSVEATGKPVAVATGPGGHGVSTGSTERAPRGLCTLESNEPMGARRRKMTCEWGDPLGTDAR